MASAVHNINDITAYPMLNDALSACVGIIK